MLLLLLSAVLVCMLVWVGTRWLRVRRYWAERDVPYLPPHPVLGSLTWLQKKNAGLWMREMYEKFRTPYIGIWLLWRPALIINSPEIARRVLIRDSDNFRNRLLSSGKNDPIGALNLFTANDPLWTTMRRPLTPVFTGAKLKATHTFIVNKSKELVQRFENELAANKTIDLRSVYSDYTTDVIGTSSFGVASDATLTGDSPIRAMTREFMKYSVVRGLSWSTIFFFPELVDVFGFSLFPKVTTDFFRKIWKQIVAQRGGYGKEVVETRDLLDALLKIKYEADTTGKDVSEDHLIAQAAVFIQGGFDTSAVILTYTTYELAFQPHIQERLYNELKETKQKIGDADFDISTLAELPYLNAVIKETLRKYPAMGWLDRRAAKDYNIDDKLTILAGTPVYINAIGLHYDPDYFPDPNTYDPTRFLPENEEKILPYTFMPFGEGPRHCIGMRFAYQTVRNALASVVYKFELRRRPDALEPNECELEKKGMFLMPANIMSVQLIPRI